MAWIESREQAGLTTHRVVWRQDGARQQQTFRDDLAAKDFLQHVNASKNHWPRGWVPGRGWAEDLDGDISTAPTFADYSKLTIRARGKADERTQDDYLAHIARHVNPVIGLMPLDKITRFHVAEVANRMQAAGLAPKTIANVHGLLSSVLSDAVVDELIRRNPAKGALTSVPDVKTEEMHFLTKGEFGQILEQVPEHYRDFTRLLAGTGLRWSEATALTVGDLDLLSKRPKLHVRRAWKRRGGLFIVGEPKTRRSRRTISLNPDQVDMLLSHVAAKNGDELVFTSVQGYPIRHTTYYARIWRPAVASARRCAEHKTAAKPCGCAGTLTKQPRIHDLRHTHVSWLIEAKISLPAIQRRVGHESIQTTIDRYGHLVPDHELEINDAVQAAMAGV